MTIHVMLVSLRKSDSVELRQNAYCTNHRMRSRSMDMLQESFAIF